jgi:hypothetical protein
LCVVVPYRRWGWRAGGRRRRLWRDSSVPYICFGTHVEANIRSSWVMSRWDYLWGSIGEVWQYTYIYIVWKGKEMTSMCVQVEDKIFFGCSVQTLDTKLYHARTDKWTSSSHYVCKYKNSRRKRCNASQKSTDWSNPLQLMIHLGYDLSGSTSVDNTSKTKFFFLSQKKRNKFFLVQKWYQTSLETKYFCRGNE